MVEPDPNKTSANTQAPEPADLQTSDDAEAKSSFWKNAAEKISALKIGSRLNEYKWFLIPFAFLLAVITLIVAYWSDIVSLGFLALQVILVFFAMGISLYISFGLLVAILSLPFFFVLVLYGVFQHPKALNTLRMGRTLLATGLVVILADLYAETLEASFAYGVFNLREEIVRGYSWIAVLLLLVGYTRALYGEGLSAYTRVPQAGGETTQQSSTTRPPKKDVWGSLLLQPAFVLSAVVFDLFVPMYVALSVFFGFRCDGLALSVQVWEWITGQYYFFQPFFFYISIKLEQFTFLADVWDWTVQTWTNVRQAVIASSYYETALSWLTSDPVLLLSNPISHMDSCLAP